MPLNQPRAFYDEAGNPVIRFELQPSGSLLRLRQTDGYGAWQCDWMLRIEPDGSLTEVGDEYPVTSRLDMFSGKISRLYFMPGHEIRWADSDNGTLWPNPAKTSPSKLGSFGTFLVKSMLVGDDRCDIYTEQRFKVQERAVYHCRRGHGIYAVDYIEPNGDSVTITEKPAGEANPRPA
jgi:hypothetical protein